MAPEVFQGNISTKADVYSFGVVLWEMVAPLGLSVEAAWQSAAYGSLSGSQAAAVGIGVSSVAIPVWARRADLRPAIAKSVDPHWRACIEQCWR
eukprot:COSAG02_NODE_49080_length_329_cov_0.847826_1_plen_93_part_01